MKKLISILLALAMLLAFTSCGEKELVPDYSKIYFQGPNVNELSALTEIKDRAGILEAFRILKSLQAGNCIIAELSFAPSVLEDVDYSALETKITFSFETMTEEEVAESLEKLSANPDIASIKCCLYEILIPVPTY
ncbi:MAG: hypothetical protein J6C89_01465 [Clostridia bacterium]|nr:hypothetical protein [Clostridia bacterium]